MVGDSPTAAEFVAHPVVRFAGIGEPLYAEKNKYPFIYRRKLGTETILVAVNPSSKPVSVSIPLKGLKSLPTELLSKGTVIKRTATGVKFEMKGISHGIFKI